MPGNLSTDPTGTDGWGGEEGGEHGSLRAHSWAYALARLKVRTDAGACNLQAGAQQVDEHTDGAYTVIPLQGVCPSGPPPQQLTVEYTLFADLDPAHRGLLNLAGPDGTTRTAVLGPQAAVQTFEALNKRDQVNHYLTTSMINEFH